MKTKAKCCPFCNSPELIRRIESLALGDDAIVLITVPRWQSLNPAYCGKLKAALDPLFPKGQRILIKHDDMNVEVLSDMLTTDDLARIAVRMERKKLNQPVGPKQARVNIP